MQEVGKGSVHGSQIRGSGGTRGPVEASASVRKLVLHWSHSNATNAMRNLGIYTTIAFCVLLTSCSNQEQEMVGSWKRTQILDAGDEPTDDEKDGYILDLNEDKSFGLRYTNRNRGMFGGSRDRNKKGTWALASPTMKDDHSALVLRFDEGNAIKEETHRVRTVSKDEIKLIFADHTSVFERR